MKIFAHKLAENGAVVALITTAAQVRGRKFGTLCNLRVVTLPLGMALEQFNRVSQTGVIVSYTTEVNAASTGPKSYYAKAMVDAQAAYDAIN